MWIVKTLDADKARWKTARKANGKPAAFPWLWQAEEFAEGLAGGPAAIVPIPVGEKAKHPFAYYIFRFRNP